MTPKQKSLLDEAHRLAREGYGWEDLAVILKIGRASARYFVFGPGK